GVLSILPQSTTAEADGASVVMIEVRIDTIVRPLNSTVVLTTTAGTLLPTSAGSGIPANDSGLVHVQLRAPTDSAQAIVTASAGGVTRTAQVLFTPAAPTGITLVTKDFVLATAPTSALDVTAQL